MRTIIKKYIERLSGIHVYKSLPRGIDYIHDICKCFPNYEVKLVFDIGANIGQSSKIYLEKFPRSHIYCFEPVSKTFKQLKENLKTNRIDFYKYAFGREKGKGEMVLQGKSVYNFLLEQSNKQCNFKKENTETVDTITLNEFCKAKEIQKINFLKIDTEGGDLEVLQGADNLLNKQGIDFLQVEAGMNPDNNKHIPLKKFKQYLEPHGYFTFGIYEQRSKWLEPHLRRSNPIFISKNMINYNA